MLTYWTAPVISKTDETIRGIINTMMTQALGHHWHTQQQSLHQNHCKHLLAFLQPMYPTDILLMIPHKGPWLMMSTMVVMITDNKTEPGFAAAIQ